MNEINKRENEIGRKRSDNRGLILTDDFMSSVKELFNSGKTSAEQLALAHELLKDNGLDGFSPEEIGEAYENLFSDRSNRKKQGVFYTPRKIVERILAETFDKWIDENPGEFPRVLEPSCGAGAFGLKVLKRTLHLEDGDEYEGLKRIPIHLNDIDEGARGVASLCMALKQVEQGKKSTCFYPVEFTDRDFLDTTQWDPDSKYDIIIGNPPYVSYYGRGSHGISNERRKELKKHFISAAGRINTYLLFIEQAIKLLNPGGKLGFIIPNTFLIMKSYEKLRHLVLDRCHLRYVADLSLGVFDGAEVPCCILVLEKRDPEELPLDQGVRVSKLAIDGSSEDSELDTGRFRKLPYMMFNVGLDAKTCSIIDKMESSAEQLGIFADIRDGINPANIKKKLVGDRKLGPNYKPLLVGKDISPYKLDWSGLFVNYDYSAVDKENGEYCFLREERIFLAEQKLVNRQTARKLIVALDDEKHYALNSCHITLIEDPKLDIHYLLALYNSDLLNFYYSSVFRETENVFPQVKTANTEKLPIKFGSSEQLSKLVTLAIARTSSFDTDNGTGDDEIEKTIAEIYGVSNEELEFARSRVPD